MWGKLQSGRRVQTTIPCRKCQKPLFVERFCQTVELQCAHCDERGTISDYIDQMDDVLETFMEGVYCDRT